ncbi:hypothetical protein, partial [Phenylobacterium sp.]|uniref:hypothetical protein n=1 Tax=Phenylobacterium sp. TaxID=1871053 RepID=UPI00286C54A7
MTQFARLAAFSALLTILGAPAAWAETFEPDPGLVAADTCMANALVESGFQGVIRIETPPDQDRSLADCDLEAETLWVAEYRAAAGPCVADRLRDLGYLGGFREPRGGLSRDEAACARPIVAPPP